MDNKEYKQIVHRYIELVNSSEELMPEDKEFFESVEKIAMLVGLEGFKQDIEEEILGTIDHDAEEPVYAAKASTSASEYPTWAAASLCQENQLYNDICQLARENSECQKITYQIPVGGQMIPLFTILPQDAIVKPKPQKGFEVSIEYSTRPPILVDEWCIESLTFYQLKKTKIEVARNKITILVNE